MHRTVALGKQAFMNKRKLFTGNFEYRVEKENSKECIMECDVLRIMNMFNDSSRQKLPLVL